MDISELSQDVAATGVEEPTPTPKTRVLIVCVTRFKDSELADITDEVIISSLQMCI